MSRERQALLDLLHAKEQRSKQGVTLETADMELYAYENARRIVKGRKTLLPYPPPVAGERAMTDITIPREAEEEVAFELWAQDYAYIDPEYRRQIWDRSYDHWWQFLPDADVVIATDDPELSNVQLGRETYIKRAHAACIAMLKAWPGMVQYPVMEIDCTPPKIVLPLPTESTNAEG